MSLLDAARALLESTPVYDADDSNNLCHYCDEPLYGATRQPLGDHEPDCPWLEVPRIAAALDAARRMVEIGCEVTSDYGDHCHFCDGEAYLKVGGEEWHVTHEPDCPWLSFVAAMGDVRPGGE